MSDNATTTAPVSITPDYSGARYCVPCVWNGRHPERTDAHGVYVVRFGVRPTDTRSYCWPHLVHNYGADVLARVTA